MKKKAKRKKAKRYDPREFWDRWMASEAVDRAALRQEVSRASDHVGCAIERSHTSLVDTLKARLALPRPAWKDAIERYLVDYAAIHLRTHAALQIAAFLDSVHFRNANKSVEGMIGRSSEPYLSVIDAWMGWLTSHPFTY